ncbi:MAG: glycosyltransferase family 4 protein [Gaiellaceae bacterium]
MPRASIVHVMGWRSQQYGSFERFLVALCARSSDEGLDSHLVFHEPPASSAFARDVARDGAAHLHVLGPPGGPAFARGLAGIVREAGATHLHGHFGADAYAGLAVARALRVRRRFTTKHIVPGTSWRSLSPLRHRWLAAQVEAFFAVSGEVGRGLRAVGVPERKIVVSHLGVDGERYRPDAARRVAARAALDIAEDERLVLSTSHLRPGKGVELLPALARELAAQPGGVCVAAAGDGPLRGLLESDGTIRLLGVREDVPDLLDAADVVVFPTTGNEGLGLGPLEALASGTPLVASAVSDLPRLLDGVARFVPPGDVSALAAACRAVLADPAAANDQAARGRRVVLERLSVDRAVDQHVSRYLARPSAGARGF